MASKRKKKPDKIMAWYAAREDCLVPTHWGGFGRAEFADDPLSPGLTLTLSNSDPIQLCWNGLHASRRLLDANTYTNNLTNVFRVVLSGEMAHGRDKIAARQRHHLWQVDIRLIVWALCNELYEPVAGGVPVGDFCLNYNTYRGGHYKIITRRTWKDRLSGDYPLRQLFVTRRFHLRPEYEDLTIDDINGILETLVEKFHKQLDSSKRRKRR